MSPTLLQAVVRVAEGRTSDAELLAKFARDRDESAFEELVRRHGALVWGVCRQLLPHHADAEDAFQAVFLALVRSAETIRSGEALAAWLHGVAVRVATKSKRTAARRKQRESRVAIPEADRPVPDAAWAALMAAVHEEVRRLPEAERVAFVLCELEGVRQPDAAAQLGWPLGTLSGRLCKARQRLLDFLARRGIAPIVLAVGGMGTSGGTAPAALVDKVNSFPSATANGIPSTVAELARGLAEGVTMRVKLMAAAVLVAGGLGITGGTMVLSKADAQTGGSGSGGGSVGGLPPGTAAPQPGGGGGLPPGAGGPLGGLGGPGASGLPPGGLGGAGGFGLPMFGGEGQPGGGGGRGGSGGGIGQGPGGPGGPGGLMVGPPVWEYKFVEQRSLGREDFEKTLTQNGKDGWEYVGSERLIPAGPGGAAGGPPAQTVLVFKRRQGGGIMGGGVIMGGGMGRPGDGGGFGPGAFPGGGGRGGPGGFPGGEGGGGGGGASGGGGRPGVGPGGGPGGGGGSGGSGGGRPGAGGPGTGPDGGEGSSAGGEGPRMRKNLFEVIKLKTANANDVLASLKKSYPAPKLRAVAETSSNSIIIIDVDDTVLKDIRKKIADLDPSSDPLPRTGGGATGGTTGGPGGGGTRGPGDGTGGPPMGSGTGSSRPGGAGPRPPMGGGDPTSGGGSPGRPGGGRPVESGDQPINVLALRHAEAVELTQLLKQVFPTADFTPDPRTNSIVCRGDEKTMQSVQALVIRLDVEVAKKSP